uniref:Uncharacterized protein n=1 Tax=Nelumbo nucifera TaxID=4432 RepID=A0A822Y7V2_NELNU|nr:TPA_asm: hypothetical protein HUJ06_031582 [Nelumbo nucifera]
MSCARHLMWVLHITWFPLNDQVHLIVANWLERGERREREREGGGGGFNEFGNSLQRYPSLAPRLNRPLNSESNEGPTRTAKRSRSGQSCGFTLFWVLDFNRRH